MPPPQPGGRGTAQKRLTGSGRSCLGKLVFLRRFRTRSRNGSSARRSRRISLLNASIIGPVEYRMRYFGEDEKTAKKMLPDMEDMTDDDGESEIE